MLGEANIEQVPNHAYVIDPNYRLVSLDRETKLLFPQAEVGNFCFKVLRGLSEPCDDCPWARHLSTGINQAIVFNRVLNTWVDLSYMTLEWPDSGECILMNARGIDQIPDLLSLFNKQTRYDKLIEMNITQDYMRILFLEQNKFVDFESDDSIEKIINKSADLFVHPEDRAKYLAFWNTETLTELFNSNRSAQEEYRRKLVDGGWNWVSQVVIPVKHGHEGEIVFMCFMVDVEAQNDVSDKNHHSGNEYLNQLLERNALTGLYTPHAFDEKAKELVLDNPSTLYEILYLDIEHFKVFNERYGRKAGDEILKAIAHDLFAISREHGGFAGYVGGDDFTLIIPHGAVEHETLVKNLTAVMKTPGHEVECLPAIGVTTVSDSSVPISTYCDHAMTAMNVAKGMYSSRYAWFEDTMMLKLEEEPKALIEIEQALKNREFVLHFQPKCNLKTGQMVGLEALVRWQHPERGLVYPGDFIPLMERVGLIASLDVLVWEEACRQLRDWTDRGIPALPISVNMSRADLQFIDVVNVLEDMLEQYDLDRELIELEITESAFVEDTAVLDTVIDLSDHRFTLLMDDFGSGYSSLNMLKDIPVDILKIDMRFLDIAENVLSRGESILDAVVSMAHILGLSVIAEGAETKEQVEFLRSINCDFVQGYYFYRPMPVDKLEALLTRDGVIDYIGANRKQVELLSPVDLVQNYVTNKTVLDAILGGVVIYSIKDGTLELEQANNRYFQLVGDNPPGDEKERREFFTHAPDEVVAEIIDLLEEARKHPVTGADEEFCQRRRDGLYIWIKVKAFFLGREGEKDIFFGKVTDISQLKDQEGILRASEDALGTALGLLTSSGGSNENGSNETAIAAFIRNLPGALIGIENKDQYPILFANNEVAFILGYVSYGEFLEDSNGRLQTFIHPEDFESFKNYLISEAHSSTRGLLEFRLKRKSDTYVTVYAQCKVIEQEENSLVMLNLINMDKVSKIKMVNLGHPD